MAGYGLFPLLPSPFPLFPLPLPLFPWAFEGDPRGGGDPLLELSGVPGAAGLPLPAGSEDKITI